MTQYQSGRSARGFTIVELLIIVIVIAILATITIVGFTGIQQRARTSAVQNEVAQLVRQLEAARVSAGNEQYPANQAAANLKISSGMTVNYIYTSTANTYCVDAQMNGITYSSGGAGSSLASTPCSIAGLVASWGLNGTAEDSLGNSYNGVAVDTVDTAGQNGAAGSALLFNGTTSNITGSTRKCALSDRTDYFCMGSPDRLVEQHSFSNPHEAKRQ